MTPKAFRIPLILIAMAICFSLLACGGGTNSASAEQDGSLSMVLSDDATQDWATIGVKVLSVTLTPQGGGNPVTIYTAPTPAPFINLVQLDQLGEIIGNAPIPAGTYGQAIITVSGNSSDIILSSAPNPEPGFPLQTPTTVNPSQIQVVGGGTGSVPLTVNLSPVLTVTSNTSNALDLEFDLSNPAFIVEHVSAAYPSGIWVVNFNPAVRHHPIRDITKLVLRQTYGTVTAISGDNTSITISKIIPKLPAQNPETYSTTNLNLTILADSTNGTIYRNLDTGGAKQVITDFSSVATSLLNNFVRIQARYQQNGTLVATRIWSSSSFTKVYVNAEGHVFNVNPSANTFMMVNADGTTSTTVAVDSATQFFFQNGTTPIGTGTTFLGAPNFVNGFKVSYDSQDDSVIIEIARFSGLISAPGEPQASNTNFTYSRTFDTSHNAVTLDYISGNTANGEDNGNPINGFKWWYFAQPTGTLTYGVSAISQFVNVANASGINYGGTSGTLSGSQPVAGESYANWNDPANPNNAWSAQWVDVLPTPAPLCSVYIAASNITNGATFTMQAVPTPFFTGTANQVTVDLSSQSGQATLVYQVDVTNGIVTVTPMDITQANTLTTVVNKLGRNTLVKVYGVPSSSPSGILNAYVLFYFTGTQPSQ
jgi:hypothetical protein